MTLVETAIRTTHLLIGAVWVGAVAFVTVGVLPLAREGELNAAPLERIVGRLRTLSRVSAVVLLLTGGHMAATIYTVDTLTGTGRGHLVLGMVALWLVLTALVEVGGARMTDGFQEKKVRAPAREHRRWFQAASLVGVVLFVDAGLIASGLV